MAESRSRRFRHRIELAGVRLLAWLPRLLPYSWSVGAAGLLGVVAFDMVRIRRRVTVGNIERALGDALSPDEIVRTGRRSYVNFARSMMEFISLPRLGRERIRGMVRLHGREHVDAALEEGKGAIAVTGHFGSWELLGAAAVAYGMPADFLVGEQTNRLVDDYINSLRASAGIGILPMGFAVRQVFGALRKNRLVALLSDQDARKMGIFADFFGIPASTYPGAAQFARKTGCPIIFCYIVRGRGGTHDAYFMPVMRADEGAEKEADVHRLTSALNLELEKAIRENPDHYFWAHRRWKTKPPQ